MGNTDRRRKINLRYTINNKGVTSIYIDNRAQQFIEYAANQPGPVLEIGAAYGTVTLAALQAGATVIANDIEEQHLQILYNNTPQEIRSRLTLLPGCFPEVLQLPANSLRGFFASRTLGHLDFMALRQGFEKLFFTLCPGSKLFIISGTPYTRVFKNLIPVYEQRLLYNELWPGYFPNLKKLVEKKYADFIPDTLNFLDEKVLSRELGRVGFVIEESYVFARADLPEGLRLDGREGYFTVAIKPR
ncbi:methyltransferase domain-containing protein [Legionella tunisiensis]|uniref:class I SAM-dependent methyltransferase n=1 Tax=Legionella tunisiensis TaxID=1034944 RepID=UPI0002F47703|nr:class I SAM-dependent methyltransferase [Legionella tunisiensis]